MRGLNALVTQPQSDHCNIDPGLKQVQSTAPGLGRIAYNLVKMMFEIC
jgi:hypothetical protein